MSVSVVVPTRDRPVALERCLAALACQTAAGLEVVVVDDGSADVGAVPATVARALPAARVVHGLGEGPAAARNRGARAAGGAVICFTDDDCAPAPRWAELLAGACAGAEAAAAAGTTVADPASGPSVQAGQLLTHVLQVQSLEHGSLGFAPTCNLACTAALAARLPFDETFVLAAGEDRDWCARLAAAGVVLRHVPAATVLHRPTPGLRAMLRQQRRYGRGAVRLRGTGGQLAGRAFYGRLARESARAGPRVAALVVLAQVAVAVGAAQEARVVRAARRNTPRD